MERVKVKSSSINSIGYDNENKILEIEFNTGVIYQYQNVNYEVYRGFFKAESVGKFFFKNIKEVYKFKKIGEEDNEC